MNEEAIFLIYLTKYIRKNLCINQTKKRHPHIFDEIYSQYLYINQIEKVFTIKIFLFVKK